MPKSNSSNSRSPTSRASPLATTISAGLCQVEMAAHTAERLESVRLFSSNRVCLKIIQPLCLIEYVPPDKVYSNFVL